MKPTKLFVVCQAFLKCKNEATTTLNNVILGEVPCCERCKERLSEEPKDEQNRN